MEKGCQLLNEDFYENARIRALPPMANRRERGVHAASSFTSPQANRFVYAGSDTEAA